MGSMGPCIFDNDAALDVLDEVMEIPLEMIQGFVDSEDLAVEHIDAVAASIAIHMALVRGCEADPPTADVVSRLEDRLLRLFDERFDDLRPKPGHKQARRAELVKLLTAYRKLAE